MKNPWIFGGHFFAMKLQLEKDKARLQELLDSMQEMRMRPGLQSIVGIKMLTPRRKGPAKTVPESSFQQQAKFLAGIRGIGNSRWIIQLELIQFGGPE